MPATVDPTFLLGEVRDWCAREHFRPARGRGQNFLVDPNMRSRIVESAGAAPGSRVLEVGAGLGALTQGLLETGARVTAIEKDARLCALLRARWQDLERFSLVEADALQVSLDSLLEAPFDMLVANLPYSVGTRILMRMVRHPLAPARMVVSVQSEVADRLAAEPGSSVRGLAGVWAQRHYDVRVLRRIPPDCFWPKPTVRSALVALERHDADRLNPREGLLFECITRHAFMHRRKQLRSLWRLAPEPIAARGADLPERFAQAGVRPEARPETLSVAQWRALAHVWNVALQDREQAFDAPGNADAENEAPFYWDN